MQQNEWCFFLPKDAKPWLFKELIAITLQFNSTICLTVSSHHQKMSLHLFFKLSFRFRLWKSRVSNNGTICAISVTLYPSPCDILLYHYNGVIMGAMASQITSLAITYLTAYSDGNQRKHRSSGSLAFVLGIHRGPVNSPHKGPVTRKMFPFEDVIIIQIW